MSTVHQTAGAEDHFASPASITDELCDLKAQLKKSFGDRLHFFENASRTHDRHRPPSPFREDEASFTSTEIDSMSDEREVFVPVSVLKTVYDSVDTCKLVDTRKSIGRSVDACRSVDKSIDKSAQTSAQTSNMASNMTPVELLKSNTNSPNNIKALIEKLEINRPPPKSSLPSSSEILQDFTRFPSRPSFLKVTSGIKHPQCIKTDNLYRNQNILFSKIDLSSSPFVFRGPGCILQSRPSISLSNSVVTELGIKHYVKVHAGAETGWVVLKSLDEPEADIGRISQNDRLLSSFILSDVTSEIYKRTSFLIFNGKRCIGKIIGQSLCICINEKIIKAIRICGITRMGSKKIRVDAAEIELSCEIERDEWLSVLERVK